MDDAAIALVGLVMATLTGALILYGPGLLLGLLAYLLRDVPAIEIELHVREEDRV